MFRFSESGGAKSHYFHKSVINRMANTLKIRADRSQHVNLSLNPFSSNSDQPVNSPFNITSWSSIQAMRIKKMITEDELSWFLNKRSQPRSNLHVRPPLVSVHLSKTSNSSQSKPNGWNLSYSGATTFWGDGIIFFIVFNLLKATTLHMVWCSYPLYVLRHSEFTTNF